MSAVITGAASLRERELRDALHETYVLIGGVLRDSGDWHAVRYWNYIPRIHEAMAPGLTRYMVFNAGRFAALEELHGGRGEFERSVASATGVGHKGEDLHVHCLAARTGGRAVENPRQVPAYRYSTRYGPVPPCFARATEVACYGSRTLLVAGTSAVQGEDSTHPDDLPGQLDDTFENLTLVVAAARGEPPTRGVLERFRHLRAYVVREADAPGVRRAIERAFVGLRRLEVVHADVCRPELLVEIEGSAEL